MNTIANLSDIAETIANVLATRDAIFGWMQANLDIVHMIQDTHKETKIVRTNLKLAR